MLIVIGLLTVVAGIVLNTYNTVASRPYQGVTEAKVVEILSMERDPNEAAEFRSMQAAVFEFYADGKLMKVVDKSAPYPCPYELNQRVTICYDPDYPVMFKVIHRENRRIFSIVLNIMGVILLLIGVFIFLRYAVRFMF